MDYDPVPKLNRKHFEEAFGNARKSVGGEDLQKYRDFKMKFDPSFKQ